MDELYCKILKLTEEITRYRAALEYLKFQLEEDIENGYNGSSDIKNALMIAGVITEIPKKKNVIKYENSEDIAYES